MVQGFMIKDMCDYPYKDGETYTTPQESRTFEIELLPSRVPYNIEYKHLNIYLVEFGLDNISYFCKDSFTVLSNKIKIIGKCTEPPDKILPPPYFNKELLNYIRKNKNIDDIYVEKIDGYTFKLINLESGNIITPIFFQCVNKGATKNQRIVQTKQWECNIINEKGEYLLNEWQNKITPYLNYYFITKNRKTSIITTNGEVLKIINYPCEPCIYYKNTLIKISTTAIAISKTSFNFLDNNMNLIFKDWITCKNIELTQNDTYLCYFDIDKFNIINGKGEKLLPSDYYYITYSAKTNKYVAQLAQDTPPVIIDENLNIKEEYTYEEFMSIVINEVNDYYYIQSLSPPF